MLTTEFYGFRAWREMGPPIRRNDPPAVLSHNAPQGRSLIFFGQASENVIIAQLPRDDATDISPIIMAIDTQDMMVLAVVAPGENYQMFVCTDNGVAAQIRWTNVPELWCPDCKKGSPHPEDIRNGYCPKCHKFPEDRSS